MTYDRSAVMREAHKQMRQSKALGLGWDWSHCLRFAWRKIKGKHEIALRRSHDRIGFARTSVVPYRRRDCGSCHMGAYQ